MPLIYLVRHGENDYASQGRLAGRLEGVHLNEKGLRQAASLAEMFAKKRIHAVYSSPLERTIETATSIAQALGLEVHPREGLLEIDFGVWQGQKLKVLQRRKLWHLVQGAPSRVRFPQGESFLEAQKRAVEEIETLANAHKRREAIICVTHGDIIKLVIAYFLGMPIDTFQRIAISPATVTTLYLDSHGCRLLNLNWSERF